MMKISMCEWMWDEEAEYVWNGGQAISVSLNPKASKQNTVKPKSLLVLSKALQ